MHHITGPLWGNIIIVVLAGAITLACFGVMFRMLWRPGEKDHRHVKYSILRYRDPGEL